MSIFSILVIALGTLKGFARDRIFHTTLIFAILFTLFAYLLSGLTIVESRKILLDFGLAAISLSGVALAIFIGVGAVGKEIETKTIYTILSKPVTRLDYLLGKFLGGAMVCAVTHLLVSLALVAILVLQGDGFPVGLWTCFYLMVLESLLLLAVALFFSATVSSNILAAGLTVALFLVGSSANSFRVMAARTESEVVKWTMRFFYDVFPNMDRFNIRELVAYSKSYDESILLWSSLYFVAYSGLFLTATFGFFRKRDLS